VVQAMVEETEMKGLRHKQLNISPRSKHGLRLELQAMSVNMMKRRALNKSGVV